MARCRWYVPDAHAVKRVVRSWPTANRPAPRCPAPLRALSRPAPPRSARCPAPLRAPLRAVNQVSINQTDVVTTPVPVPPKLEQDEIVRRVETLFKLADLVEKRVAAATARAEHLTQAILAKAFRGELVPTEAELARRDGREYESAAVLIERVKKEREQAASENAAKGIRKNRSK